MSIDIQTNEMVSFVIAVLTNIAGAAVVVALGFFIAAAARRFTRKMLERPDIAHALGPSIVRLLSGAVYYLLLLLAAAGGLIALGVPAAAVLAVLAVVVVVLAVALQQSAANFAATVIFLMFQPLRRGELVMTMGYMGTVQEILLFDTVLRLPDQRLVSLPNSKIHDNGIVNYSRHGQVRADFTLTVRYAEDVSQARALIAEIGAADERVLTEPALQVVVDELGESGVRLLVLPYVAPENYWSVRSDMREQVKARFDAAGIRFALPERNVHFSPAAQRDAAGRLATVDHTADR
jgi:small conductance mechanosensitive channel